MGWQILMPPFDFDLGDAGKGASEGWAFWTCYNAERATGKLEVTATQRDRDYVVAVNWKAAEQAAKEGKVKMISGVAVIDPKLAPGVVYLIPRPRVRTVSMSVPTASTSSPAASFSRSLPSFTMEKILAAIQNKDFSGDEDGIPVLNYDHVKEAEVNVGLGPLHTQFDDQTVTPTPVCSLNQRSPNGSWEPGKSSTRFRSATTSATSRRPKATRCIRPGNIWWR